MTEDELRALLIRARNQILLRNRREAYDRMPEPSPLLLEIDAALGIEDHGWYAETIPETEPAPT